MGNIYVTEKMILAATAILDQMSGADLDGGWVSTREIATKIIVASLSASDQLLSAALPPLQAHSLPGEDLQR